LKDLAALFDKMKAGGGLSEEELRSQASRELNALRKSIEDAKIKLSSFESVPLNFIYQGAPRQEQVSMPEFEKAVAPKVEEAKHQ
jgi:hypothetical protein